MQNNLFGIANQPLLGQHQELQAQLIRMIL